MDLSLNNIKALKQQQEELGEQWKNDGINPMSAMLMIQMMQTAGIENKGPMRHAASILTKYLVADQATQLFLNKPAKQLWQEMTSPEGRTALQQSALEHFTTTKGNVEEIAIKAKNATEGILESARAFAAKHQDTTIGIILGKTLNINFQQLAKETGLKGAVAATMEQVSSAARQFAQIPALEKTPVKER